MCNVASIAVILRSYNATLGVLPLSADTHLVRILLKELCDIVVTPLLPKGTIVVPFVIGLPHTPHTPHHTTPHHTTPHHTTSHLTASDLIMHHHALVSASS